MKLFLICARDYDKHSHTSALSLTTVLWGGSLLSFPWHKRENWGPGGLSILPKSPQLIKQESWIWTQALKLKSLDSWHLRVYYQQTSLPNNNSRSFLYGGPILQLRNQVKGLVTTEIVADSGLNIEAKNECQASYGSLSAWCSGSETELPAGVPGRQRQLDQWS